MENNSNTSLDLSSRVASTKRCKCLYEILNINPASLPNNGPLDQAQYYQILETIATVRDVILLHDEPKELRAQTFDLISEVAEALGTPEREQYYREHSEKVIGPQHNCETFKYEGIGAFYQVLKENSYILAMEREKRTRKPNSRYANEDYELNMDTTDENQEATQDMTTAKDLTVNTTDLTRSLTTQHTPSTSAERITISKETTNKTGNKNARKTTKQQQKTNKPAATKRAAPSRDASSTTNKRTSTSEDPNKQKDTNPEQGQNRSRTGSEQGSHTPPRMTQEQAENRPTTGLEQQTTSKSITNDQTNTQSVTPDQTENRPKTGQKQNKNKSLTSREQANKATKILSPTKSSAFNAQKTIRGKGNTDSPNEKNKESDITKPKEHRQQDIIDLTRPESTDSELTFTSTEISQPSSKAVAAYIANTEQQNQRDNAKSPTPLYVETHSQSKDQTETSSTGSYSQTTRPATRRESPKAGPSHTPDHADTELLKQQLATKENEYDKISDMILNGKLSVTNPITERLMTQLDSQINALKAQLSSTTGTTTPFKKWHPTLDVRTPKTQSTVNIPRANVTSKKRRASTSPKTGKQERKRKRHMGWMTNAEGVIADGYKTIKKVTDHDKENGWEALIIIFEGSKDENRDDATYKMHPKEALKFGWDQIKRYLSGLTPPRIRNLQEHYKQLYLIYQAKNEQELDKEQLDKEAKEADVRHKAWKEKHYNRILSKRKAIKDSKNKKDKETGPGTKE